MFSPCGGFEYWATDADLANGGIVEVASGACELQLPTPDPLRTPNSSFFWLHAAEAQSVAAVLPYLQGYMVSLASPLRKQVAGKTL